MKTETGKNLKTLQRTHHLTYGVAWAVRGIKGVNSADSNYGKADCGTFVSGGTPTDEPVKCPKCEESR